jgi:cytochrome c peroxidase
MKTLGVVPAGLSFEGPAGPVRIEEFFEPCSARSRILVVRSSAAWCRPCLWQAAHTTRFKEDPRVAGRLVLLDLLLADEDNGPADSPSLARWQQKIDGPERVAVDAHDTFGPALLSRAPLPEYAFVDTRTMRILSTMSNPDPESLVGRLQLELADLDKSPRPELRSPTVVDGRFTEDQMDLIRGMKLVAAPPPDPTNEVADSAAAVILGKALFSDTRLSPSGVTWATCHDPGQDLGDGAAHSTGVGRVDRNAPAIGLAAHARWQFWDGRADTLWMQALGPPENAKEIGSSRLFIAHRIVEMHAASYDAVFGAKYPLPVADLAAMPASGKPGEPTYDALSSSAKDAVTRIYVKVGKAIAAFERAIRVKPNALDRYADGELEALTPAQKDALLQFFVNGCAQCHWGPRLTDDAFHVVRFGTGRRDGAADLGRSEGLVQLQAGEFLASSRWSDAPLVAKLLPADSENMVGAFKTPTLRGLPTSAPYGHGGTLSTLAEVAHQYGERGLPRGRSERGRRNGAMGPDLRRQRRGCAAEHPRGASW